MVGSGFVRGEHWAKQWADLSQDLREIAKTASGEDKRRLLAWAAEADRALKEAGTLLFRARLISEKLPAAIAEAQALHHQAR